MAKSDRPKMGCGGKVAVVQMDRDQTGPAIARINLRDNASGQINEPVYE
jgi:hypothetical protein